MRRPNRVQRLLHRFFLLRPVSAFFAPRVHRIDWILLRLTGGRVAASQILGWNIIQLTTTGARTGQPRTMPLIGLFDRDRIALIASSFGREHNPGWYYNLKAHPECEVQFRGCSRSYRARETIGEEYDLYWQMAVSFYAGYETYQQSASHRRIPVVVLEPRS